MQKVFPTCVWLKWQNISERMSVTMSACINQYQVEKMVDGRCELEKEELDTEARFATRLLSEKFKDSNKWHLQNVITGKIIPGGVKIQLRVEETECNKKEARSNAECAEVVTGAVRECEVTIGRSRNRLNVRESQCGSDVVTRCDECWEDPDDTMEVAKFAVDEITEEFQSNKWALQHISKAHTKVVKNKYIVYNLSLHMAETTCSRLMRSAYSGQCWIRSNSPTNYCEVTVLASLKSNLKKVSKKTCAGYNVSKYF